MPGWPLSFLRALESTCGDVNTDALSDSRHHTQSGLCCPEQHCLLLFSSPIEKASMTNKRVPQRACRWLAALRSCIQAPRTEAENTAKGEKKKMVESRGYSGWKQAKAHVRRRPQHSWNNGLEINGSVIHPWSDAALAGATWEPENN